MKPEINAKKCFAVGCDAIIPRAQLMCRDHWARVPSRVRMEVLDTWRDWDRGGALRPYSLATWRAQLAVAHAEHREPAETAIRAIIAELEKRQETPHAA
jgi:hypothetical protein